MDAEFYRLLKNSNLPEDEQDNLKYTYALDKTDQLKQHYINYLNNHQRQLGKRSPRRKSACMKRRMRWVSATSKRKGFCRTSRNKR
jgi:hypothetical protein